MEGPGWGDRDKPSQTYRDNLMVWKDRPAFLPGELPEVPYSVVNNFEGVPDEVRANYGGHLRDVESQNAPPEPAVPLDPDEIGEPLSGGYVPPRKIRSRSQTYEELDPRLIDQKTEDDGEDFDFKKPCKNCTPNPEDL